MHYLLFSTVMILIIEKDENLNEEIVASFAFLCNFDLNLDKSEDIVVSLRRVAKSGWEASSHQSLCLNVQEKRPGKYKGEK